MANEILTTSAADLTMYFVVVNSSGHIWSDVASAFVSAVDANWANYDQSMTEQGTSTGIYVGSMPSVPAGTYTILCYSRATGTPLVTDPLKSSGPFLWNGTGEVTGPTGATWITVDQFKTYKGITVSTYDDKIDSLIGYVCAWITNYLDTEVKQSTVTDILYLPNAQSYLRVNNRFNNSLTTLTLQKYDTNEDSTISASDLWFQESTLRFKPSSNARRYFAGIVEVTYVTGYADGTVPEDLQLAALELCANVYDTSNRDGTVDREKIGDYAYVNSQLDDPQICNVKSKLASFTAVGW